MKNPQSNSIFPYHYTGTGKEERTKEKGQKIEN